MKVKEFYKIRSKKTGLFSKGGGYAKFTTSSHWSANGKIWQGIGPLKNHLALYKKRDGTYDLPEDWEIVVIEQVVISAIQVHEFLGITP